ncbi:uncharacterized protein [Rutidosis leptorrhynchoides]|uniref:uncharacterized protein n=1 Tax=Rutidosis leptorrhynchoides TaxID=125765 RepID=UPI003A99CAB1
MECSKQRPSLEFVESAFWCLGGDSLFPLFPLSSKGEEAIERKEDLSQRLHPPKRIEGGLGVKPLREWNETLLVKNLWRVFAHKDTLWSKWVNLEKLKGGSIWDAVYKCNDSWGWKCILDMRNKIQNHVVIDNGSYKWKKNDGSVVNYSTQQVWRDLRSNRVKVGWHHVIWFKGLEPKHAFIMWLATLHRLYTQDKMKSWMPQVPLLCPLCEKTNDSINHLFFQCEFSSCVWKDIKAKLIFRGLPYSLDSIVQRMAVYPFTKNIWNIVNRLVIAACVYFVWRERNARLFRHQKKEALKVGEDVQNYIRWKLLSLTVKNSSAIRKVADLWNMKWVNNRFKFV